MPSFEVQTDEEIAIKKQLFTAGEATFVITSLDDNYVSKTSGKASTKIGLELWDSNGKHGVLTDYIPDSQPWRHKELCRSINKLDLYEAGNYTESDVKGEGGKCELFLQIDKSGKYEASMKVKKYLPFDERAKPAEFHEDDDIPFA